MPARLARRQREHLLEGRRPADRVLGFLQPAAGSPIGDRRLDLHLDPRLLDQVHPRGPVEMVAQPAVLIGHLLAPHGERVARRCGACRNAGRRRPGPRPRRDQLAEQVAEGRMVGAVPAAGPGDALHRVEQRPQVVRLFDRVTMEPGGR